MKASLGEVDHCLHERTTSVVDEGRERFVCRSCYYVSETRFSDSVTRRGEPAGSVQIDTE